MQKTQIIGFIGKDAEVKDLGENQVINFPVAVTEKWKSSGVENSKTTWYECAKWGNNVVLAQYLKKGTQVYVEGTVDVDAYLTNDGTARGVLRLRTFNVQLLSGGKQQGSNPISQTSAPKLPRPESLVDISNEEEDDLPF